MVKPDRPQMTISYGTEKMRFACRIRKAGIQTRHTLTILMLFIFNSSAK
jgi:hypothetical protein